MKRPRRLTLTLRQLQTLESEIGATLEAGAHLEPGEESTRRRYERLRDKLQQMIDERSQVRQAMRAAIKERR